MRHIQASLVPGETVVHQTRLHWIVTLRHLIIGLLLLAGCGALLSDVLHQPRLGNASEHLMETGGPVGRP